MFVSGWAEGVGADWVPAQGLTWFRSVVWKEHGVLPKLTEQKEKKLLLSRRIYRYNLYMATVHAMWTIFTAPWEKATLCADLKVPWGRQYQMNSNTGVAAVGEWVCFREVAILRSRIPVCNDNQEEHILITFHQRAAHSHRALQTSCE